MSDHQKTNKQIYNIVYIIIIPGKYHLHIVPIYFTASLFIIPMGPGGEM